MIVIMTGKKFKKICQSLYDSGLARGYKLGYLMGKADRNNRGIITGPTVEDQIKEIFEKKGDW